MRRHLESILMVYADAMREACRHHPRRSTTASDMLADTLDVLLKLPAIDRLEEHPFAFPRVVDEIRRAEVRRFPYSVFFRVHTKRIIPAVLHGSRNPEIRRSHG